MSERISQSTRTGSFPPKKRGSVSISGGQMRETARVNLQSGNFAAPIVCVCGLHWPFLLPSIARSFPVGQLVLLLVRKYSLRPPSSQLRSSHRNCLLLLSLRRKMPTIFCRVHQSEKEPRDE